jgi:MoxR-like ATPase
LKGRRKLRQLFETNVRRDYMNTVKKAVAIAVQTKLPVLLWGMPGVGKTSFVRQLAEKLGWHVETVIASLRDPTDFAGLPVQTKDGVAFLPPSWAKRLKESAPKALLFLDEINTAPPAVQAALLRVVLEKVVGDVELGEVSVIAAANPPEISAGGWDLAAPLANRFVHINWDKIVQPSEIIAGLATGKWSDMDDGVPVVPENWQEYIPGARAEIAAFLNARPTLIAQRPKEDQLAFPTPRTWEMAAKLLAACRGAKVEEKVAFELVAGTVGEGPAIEFFKWRDEIDLPNPEELLENPEKVKDYDLTRQDKAFAISIAVVSSVLNNFTEDRCKSAWQVINYMLDSVEKDVLAPAAKQLITQTMTKTKYRPRDVLIKFADLVVE